MSQPQAVLTHLREGREELVREVQRLTTAITELDAVIARVEGAVPAGATSSRPARASAPAGGGAGGGGKSIRVQVLEILAADDRPFPMTEILERVRAAGITAHDDAVRSITTKLMKDGRVERVGRGQYRLDRTATVAPAAPAGVRPAAVAG